MLPDPTKKFVCIVGSRKYTQYGLDVVDHLLSNLRKDIYIVSGLAVGIDTAAHTAALKYGLKTIAFPGSGLSAEVLYPKANIKLAQEISYAGCLVSEYAPDAVAQPWMFIKRNRLMAGMCHLTIVIEATEKSGTLTTARMALDYNREVGAVPGNIFHKNSEGPHRLISQGAHVIRSADDIHTILGFDTQPQLFETERTYTDEEQKIIDALLFLGTSSQDNVLRQTGLNPSQFNKTLSMLEIKSYVRKSHEGLSLVR